MKTVHVLICGFVQGVGYRHFVRSHARESGLTGWVKNLPDGRVEAVFQGSKENIEKMIELCRKGSFLAEVEDVDVEWKEMEESFSDFKIIS